MKSPMKTRASLWIYVPLWIFFVYLYVQILNFNQGAITNIFLGAMYFIQFGIHEAAHIVVGFLPPAFVAASGSVSEVVFTCLLVFVTLRAKAYFAAIFSLLWCMLAFTSMGNYVADASTQLMPLIGPSADPVHDWNYVFSELNMLGAASTLGVILKVIGGIIGTFALGFGLFLLGKMAMTPKAENKEAQ